MKKLSSKRDILGVNIDFISLNGATSKIVEWASSGGSRIVCAANVHMVMEAWDNNDFRCLLNQADLVLPDGMPLVWGLGLLGYKGEGRVRGPDLMLEVCRIATKQGIAIGLYGGSEENKAALLTFLESRFPGINLSCVITPPFRELTEQEDIKYVREINDSGVKIIFVGIGCPKQENWMNNHKASVNAVMIGVGAAFDFYSGVKKMAPIWMQNMGLEWLFRFMSEPHRLWKRYLKHNPRFLVLLLRQVLGVSLRPKP